MDGGRKGGRDSVQRVGGAEGVCSRARHYTLVEMKYTSNDDKRACVGHAAGVT